MLSRLGRIVGWVILSPTLYLLYVLVSTLHERIPIQYVPSRFLFSLFTISLFPINLLRRRYPTLKELLSLTPGDYLLMMGFIIGLLVVSLFLLRLMGRLFALCFNRFPLYLRWSMLALVLLVIAAWALLPNLPVAPVTTIIVDVSQVIGEMPGHHRGFSQGGEGQMPQVGYFETAMTALKDVAPRFIRVDHIYDYYDVYSFDDQGSPVYDWQGIDRIVDAIIEAGASPFISLSYLPPDLAKGTVYGPPSDFAAWEDLVFQTVYHLNIERELDIRYWEVWNEPNLGHFWDGTLEEYLQLYQATVRGALRADPSVKIGGPAIASTNYYYQRALSDFYERTWISELVEYTHTNRLPLDFVSWHVYAPLASAYTSSIEQHRQWLAGLDPQPLLFLTEWNWDATFTPEYDNGATVAYIAETVTALSNSPLDQAFYFEPIDGTSIWEGGWGLMRADGTTKATFNAFRLLNNLSGQRLLVSPNAALASKDGDTVSVLLWNNHEGYANLSVEVRIIGLSSDTAIEAEIYGVDNQHGNPYFENGADLFIEKRSLQAVKSGEQSITIDVPLHGIRLIQFPAA